MESISPSASPAMTRRISFRRSNVAGLDVTQLGPRLDRRFLFAESCGLGSGGLKLGRQLLPMVLPILGGKPAVLVVASHPGRSLRPCASA